MIKLSICPLKIKVLKISKILQTVLKGLKTKKSSKS